MAPTSRAQFTVTVHWWEDMRGVDVCAPVCVFWGGVFICVPSSGVLWCSAGVQTRYLLKCSSFKYSQCWKCDCSDVRPSISFGKKEHTKRKGRWRINLTTATLQKIVDCFHSQQACIPGLVHKRYGWCAAGRCVLLSWSLLSAVLTQVWPKVAKGQTPSQDWFWCLSSIIVIPDY